jgi:hypothetical protein
MIATTKWSAVNQATWIPGAFERRPKRIAAAELATAALFHHSRK